MDSNNIMSIVAVVVSIGGTILAVINHKRLRSKCFSNKEIVLSLDVENTTPPKDKGDDNDLKINIPKRPTGVALPPSPTNL
jgi:hypothetical protein